MANRSPNSRLVKIHWAYTVEEAARCLHVHRNTVKNWIRHGLEVNDDRRPILILGRALRAFLEARRASSRRPCGPAQMYCLRCRCARRPTGGAVVLQRSTSKLGWLLGACEECGAAMRRRINWMKLDAFQGHLAIQSKQGGERIAETLQPLLNCDLKPGEKTDA